MNTILIITIIATLLALFTLIYAVIILIQINKYASNERPKASHTKKLRF